MGPAVWLRLAVRGLGLTLADARAQVITSGFLELPRVVGAVTRLFENSSTGTVTAFEAFVRPLTQAFAVQA